MSKSKTEAYKEKRQYIQAPVAIDNGVPCSHCGHRFGHRVTNTYANGNRRRVCASCGKPFVSIRARETAQNEVTPPFIHFTEPHP
jgi:DNA-directed RNA polymerase subunit RPC12/RpoP